MLCGFKAIDDLVEREAAERGDAERRPLFGLNALVDGSIPPNAGLSSSSALVCCAALSVAQVNRIAVTAERMADACAKGER